MMSAIPFEVDQELYLAVRREECDDDSAYLLILWSSRIIHEDPAGSRGWKATTYQSWWHCLYMTFTVSENGKSLPASI